MSNHVSTSTSSGHAGSYNTFDRCFFEGGYYNIAMNGAPNERGVGNKIIDSELKNAHYHAIYGRNQNEWVVEGNTIHRPDRASAGVYQAIYLLNDSEGISIRNNRISNTAGSNPTNTSTHVGIYLSGVSTSSANPNVIANNKLYNFNHQGSIQGVYVTNSQHVRIYHNTFAFGGKWSGTLLQSVYFTNNNSSGEIKNNLFYSDVLKGAQHHIYINSANANVTSDGNVFYYEVGNGHIGHLGNTTHSTLNAWQGAGFDANSLVGNPFILNISQGDLSPAAPQIKGVGLNLSSSVPEDFYGVTRPNNPDPGAIEFTPQNCLGPYDIALDSVFSNRAYISWTSSESRNNIEWGPSGFQEGSGIGTVIRNATNSSGFEVSGLPSDECIDIYIQDSCAGGNSAWMGPIELCTPIRYDAEVVKLVNPLVYQCGESNAPIEVRIRNNGDAPIQSLPIEVRVSGDINQTFTTTYTGNIQYGEEVDFVAATINTVNGAFVTVDVILELPNDQVTGNDSLMQRHIEYRPETPTAEEGYCMGSDSAWLIAETWGGAAYSWFESNSSTTALSNADSMRISANGQSQTYYLAYRDTRDSLLTGLNNNRTNNGNMFNVNVLNPIIINAFDVIHSSSGTAGIEIYVKEGSYVGNEFSPSQWKRVDSVGISVPNNVDPTRVNLNEPLSLQAGNYAIYITSTTGSIRSSLNNSTGSLLAGNNDLQLYIGIGSDYAFGSTANHAWRGGIHYGTDACSDQRFAIQFAAHDSTVAQFTNTSPPNSNTVNFESHSINADSLHWDFGGLGTSSDSVTSFTFPQEGMYNVCLTAYGFCGEETICRQVSTDDIGLRKFEEAFALELYPNPGNGLFHLSFATEGVDKVFMQFMDARGRIIFSEIHQTYGESTYNKDMDYRELAAGMYTLSVRTDKGLVIRKVLIQ